MKKIIVFIVTLMLLMSLTACGNIYKGPLSCISYIGTDGQVISLMEMTEDVHKEILSLLNNGGWIDDVTNCGYDYEFDVDDTTIRYHSECGTFIDMANECSLTLAEEDRITVNRLLGVIE